MSSNTIQNSSPTAQVYGSPSTSGFRSLAALLQGAPVSARPNPTFSSGFSPSAGQFVNVSSAQGGLTITAQRDGQTQKLQLPPVDTSTKKP